MTLVKAHVCSVYPLRQLVKRCGWSHPHCPHLSWSSIVLARATSTWNLSGTRNNLLPNAVKCERENGAIIMYMQFIYKHKKSINWAKNTIIHLSCTCTVKCNHYYILIGKHLIKLYYDNNYTGKSPFLQSKVRHSAQQHNFRLHYIICNWSDWLKTVDYMEA